MVRKVPFQGINRSSILRTATTFNTREVSMGLTSGIVFAVTLIRNLAYAVFKWRGTKKPKSNDDVKSGKFNATKIEYYSDTDAGDDNRFI